MKLGHWRIHLANLGLFLIAIQLTATAQSEPQVLVLPEDQESVEALMHTGARQFMGLSGLSAIVEQDSPSINFVINSRVTAHKQIVNNLSKMSSSAYISIAQDQGLISRVAKIQLNANNIVEASYFIFEVPLLSQLYEKFADAELDKRKDSVIYTEYAFPLSGCIGLSTSIGAVESALRDATNRIGLKPSLLAGELETVVLDGKFYSVQVRMESLVARLSVSANSGPVFESIDAAMRNIHDCSEAHVGGAREREFLR